MPHCYCSVTRSASACRRGGDGFGSRPNCLITKDVEICTYYCYVICMTLLVWVGRVLTWNRWNLLQCTIRTFRQRLCIKELVVCNVWDLEPLDLLSVLSLGCYQPSRPLRYELYVTNFLLIIWFLRFYVLCHSVH